MFDGMSDTPLKRARVKAGRTLVEIGRAIGVSEATMSRPERGLRHVSPMQAEALARELGIGELEILYPDRYVEATKKRRTRRSSTAA